MQQIRNGSRLGHGLFEMRARSIQKFILSVLCLLYTSLPVEAVGLFEKNGEVGFRGCRTRQGGQAQDEQQP